jgi:8-oxo-dGTP pyrophosphatase MutT (NUDIX family)
MFCILTAAQLCRMRSMLELIRSFTPENAEEERIRRRFLDLLTTSEDPSSRSSFDPGHLTASAFVIDGSGRLLLHHHRRLGRWLQMGGHIEPGERPSAAALREAIEESGLHDLRLVSGSPFDLDIHDIPAGKGEPAHLHYDIRFAALAPRPEPIRMDAAESTDLRWFNYGEARGAMSSSESSRAIDRLEEGFSQIIDPITRTRRSIPSAKISGSGRSEMTRKPSPGKSKK